jgi:hypothetical protein
MEVIISKDREKMRGIAACLISGAIRRNSDRVPGLAAGGTPIGAKREIIRPRRDVGLDIPKATAANASSLNKRAV